MRTNDRKRLFRRFRDLLENIWQFSSIDIYVRRFLVML